MLMLTGLGSLLALAVALIAICFCDDEDARLPISSLVTLAIELALVLGRQVCLAYIGLAVRVVAVLCKQIRSKNA